MERIRFELNEKTVEQVLKARDVKGELLNILSERVEIRRKGLNNFSRRLKQFEM